MSVMFKCINFYFFGIGFLPAEEMDFGIILPTPYLVLTRPFTVQRVRSNDFVSYFKTQNFVA